MKTVFNVVCILLFDSSNISSIIFMVLYIIGLWRIFEKSGLKGWWALIPGARDYQLARCAGREAEGRMYSVSGVMITLLSLTVYLMQDWILEDPASIPAGFLMVSVLILVIALVRFIYTIRVWSGLIDVYGLRKRWIWLCLNEYVMWIPALVWGWGKKYQPEWKVEDIRAELARLASSGSAQIMDEGLTVNLKDRTVTEFFQKKVLLRDIHMAIPQGHMVLLLGGSGAGKTTFLNAVNGYEKAHADVMLNGTNMYTQYKKCSMRWVLYRRRK